MRLAIGDVQHAIGEQHPVRTIQLALKRVGFRAVAQVAWQNELPGGPGYETGLQFIEIAPEDRDSIAGWVERGVVS